MKFGKRDKSIVDALFLLALFGVFLVCALFIVLFGAKIYKNTVKSSEDSFFERTCCTYITEKIRQNDNTNGVNIISDNGDCRIMLTKSIDEADYTTYLYCDNGHLKEYTASANNDFNPSLGTEILEISSLSAQKCNDNLYRFCLESTEGNKVSFYVSVTSDIGGGVDE